MAGGGVSDAGNVFSAVVLFHGRKRLAGILTG
jgi:hypothetical protein